MALKPIFYDTETTGIKAESDRIVEIAAYDPSGDRTFEMLVNPGIPIPQEASRVHNITDEMVASAPSFETVGKLFVEFCESDDYVLIAHNNDGFDIHFLKHEFARHSIPFLNCKFMDTLKWARRYRPDLPRHSLQFLREIYGFPPNNAHRALDDVIVLHQVFTCMTDDLPMDVVYTLLNQPKEITHMPFGKHQGKLLEEIPQDYLDWLVKSDAFQKEENKALKEQLVKLGRVALV